jgi:hypothetical protein
LKTEDWATEFEYRFVFQRASEVPLANFVAWNLVSYGHALRYVVVGEKFPDRQLPDTAGVELRRMQWQNARPYPAKVRITLSGDAPS